MIARHPLVLKASVVAVLVLFAVTWLAGYIVTVSYRRDIKEVTPLTALAYAYYYGDQPKVRQRLVMAAGGSLALIGGCGLALLWPRKRGLHGDARFATRTEIAQAGLLGDQGIVLGRLGGKFVMLPGQQGVALAAPPRAGKGAGVVIPNALNWAHSMVCLDLKRENWNVTAGFRKECRQDCFLFEPFAEDGRTARWNPLSYVDEDPVLRISDIQRIAAMLYPDPQNVDPFWSASARSLFLGIALYLFETPSMERTIGEVLRQGMASDDEGFAHHWKRIIEGRNANGHPLSAECTRAIYDVIDLAPQTASSIRKTFTSRLDLWLNPILDAATSGNDFDLRELRSKRMSIYVGVNPEDLHRLRPVLSLFFQQAIGLHSRVLPEHDPKLKYQIMMLLDEFTALGRIPIIAESIAYLPGYNVRVVLVIQTPAQLREVYGAELAETMLKSLGVRIAFTPKDYADAKEISDELGNQTIRVRTVSQPQWNMSSGKGRQGRTINMSEQRRPLMLPQEVKEMSSTQAIVFCEGLRPFKCTKIRYFRDRVWKARLRPPPPRPPRLDIKPAPPIERAIRGAANGSPASSAVSSVRLAQILDVDRMDQLTLKNLPDSVAEFEFSPGAEGEDYTDDALLTDAERWIVKATQGGGHG